MSDNERWQLPRLSWVDLRYPSPMQQLDMSRVIKESFNSEKGREPTAEEHHEAFQKKLSDTENEMTEQQLRDAVQDARNIIEELTTFVERYGGTNE
jgi:hypothetical protein